MQSKLNEQADLDFLCGIWFTNINKFVHQLHIQPMKVWLRYKAPIVTGNLD